MSPVEAHGLREVVLLGLARGVLVWGVLAAVLVGVTTVQEGEQTSAPWLEAPSRAERLVERFECWTGAAPEGAIPGHAIVTLPGERAERVAAETGFGIWLGEDGEAGTGDEIAGTLVAFCP